MKTKKTALNTKITELENEKKIAESDLKDIEDETRRKKTSLEDWKRSKSNASLDMEYYRQKMNEAV